MGLYSDESGNNCKIMSRKVMWFDLSFFFFLTSLAVVLRTGPNYGGGGGQEAIRQVRSQLHSSR